jgi:predicted glycosyltransferase/glutathione peroxidase-family protein
MYPMKILFYLGHPAQFHFSKNIIKELNARGHEVKILIKSKDMLEYLVVNEGFQFENIHKGYHKNRTKLHMFFESMYRSVKVMFIAWKWKPDLLIGTDSSIAQAAFLLNRPALTVLEDDYNVIRNLARLTYPFTTAIVTPQVCSVGKWESKKIPYNGYMKLAYLHPKYFTADCEVVKRYIKADKFWLVRLVELSAHHDDGIKGLNLKLVHRIIDVANRVGFAVYITSEGDLDPSLAGYQLKINQSDIHHVIGSASMLISDSQSMSVEAALLGIPSLRFSGFVGKISVLEELEHEYQLTFGFKTSQSEKLIQRIVEIIEIPNREKVFEERRQKMLSDKIDVTDFFVRLIEKYPVSGKTRKRDFTLETYSDLLVSIGNAGYSFYTFRDYCEGKATGKYVILRHDVDLKAENSLATARIEAAYGVRSTYYFRYVRQSNKPDIIRQIAELGHEIGYHYEEMSIFKGNTDKAILFFQKQLAYFRQFYPVATISMHGSPTSQWDNRELWSTYDYRNFGIIGEPYFDFLNVEKHKNKKIYYFTDTGRMWNGDKFNVRDKMVSGENNSEKINVHKTSDLITWLKTTSQYSEIMITTHPQRWTNKLLPWVVEFVLQRLKNIIKLNLAKGNYSG